MSSVTGLVKALPKSMVGQAALINLFPIFTQVAQRLLHFSPTHDRHPCHFWRFLKHNFLASIGNRGLNCVGLLQGLCRQSQRHRGHNIGRWQSICRLKLFGRNQRLVASKRLNRGRALSGHNHFLFRIRLDHLGDVGGLVCFDGYFFKQGLCLLHQLKPQLVGSPLLPSFQLTGCSQCCLGLVLQFFIQQASVLFQDRSQVVCCTGTCFAMSFCHFGFKYF